MPMPSPPAIVTSATPKARLPAGSSSAAVTGSSSAPVAIAAADDHLAARPERQVG